MERKKKNPEKEHLMAHGRVSKGWRPSSLCHGSPMRTAKCTCERRESVWLNRRNDWRPAPLGGFPWLNIRRVILLTHCWLRRGASMGTLDQEPVQLALCKARVLVPSQQTFLDLTKQKNNTV